MRRRLVRKLVATFFGATVLIAGLPLVTEQPALAGGPTIPADIQSLLTGLHQWGVFTQSFGTQGPLGQPLPLVSLTPGSSAGLGFGPTSGADDGLIGDAVYDVLNSQVQGLGMGHTVVLGDLGSTAGTSYPIDLHDGRTGTLTVTSSTNGSNEALTIGLDITRTVTNQVLDVRGSVGVQPVTLTSTGGVQVTLHTHVSFDANVQPSGAGYYFYIGHDANGPSIEVDAKSTIPKPSDVDASIGILGVSLSAAAFSSDENLSVSLSDPDNDGQLPFTNVDGSTGELGQSGATTGLVHVGYASNPGSVTDSEADQGSTTPATFTVTPIPLQTGSNALPDVTLDVSWPNVSTGSPTITNPDGNLQYANDFLNLSTKDLVNGIGHLATTVSAIQRSQWGNKTSPSGNFDLPFMNGTAADAVDASAALSGFVTEFTYGPANPNPSLQTADPAKTGTPTFASVQELVTDLDKFAPNASPAPSCPTTCPLAGGATITVGTIDFNDSNSGPNKLLIPLTIQTSAPASAIQLDVQPILASGSGSGVTYTSTSMTDTSLGAAGFNSDLAGQTVDVTTGTGLETAIVNNVAGDTLNLKPQTEVSGNPDWVIPPASPGAQPTAGTTPADDDAYKIVGPDPKSGSIQLGNSLGDGVVRANADASKATVKPSYSLNVGLVLNLEPAITGSACNSNTVAKDFPQYSELPANCPFQHTNADGSTTSIQQLPTNTDRIEMRTGSVAGFSDFLTEDFPVTSPAPDDFAAQVGYLGIHLSGQMTLDTPSSGHMRTIDLQPQTAGDGSSDLTLDQVTRDVVTTSTASSSSLLTESMGGSLSGHFAVDVPDSSTSATPSYFGESDTCSADGSVSLPCFSINWGDISTGSPTVTPDAPLSELNDFNFDTTTPTALVTPLIKSLQVLDSGLSGLSGSSATLGTQVPMLGQPIGSLVGAQDSGSGPNVTFGSATLTDSARPYDGTNDVALVGRTMTVGTQTMTIQSVAASGGGTQFTFTQSFPTQPADGTAYSLTSALKDAVGPLAAQPPANLQDLLGQLDKTLGDNSTATIGIDTSGGTPALVVKLDWKRTAHSESTLSLPVQTSCTGGSCPDDNLVESPTPSPIVTTTTGNDVLGVEVPLKDGTGPADPTALDVTGSSEVSGGLQITGADSGTPDANIGPLAVKLGGGSDHLQVSGAYGVQVGNGSGTTQSLSNFLGQAPTMSSAGTSCPSASVTAAALCAFIPVYNGSTEDGPVTVDIADSAANLLDPTGNVSETNTQLGDDIKAAQISFGGLLGGIDNYFTLAEQGLKSASFDGKLPFVGSDLQQGSDFVGKLKDQFDSAVKTFTSSIPSTAGGIQTTLQSAITGALPSGTTATVNTSCTAPLQAVSGVHVAAKTDSASTQSWYYDVLGYKTVGGTMYVTKPGAAAENPVTNDTTLDSTNNFNTITWTANSTDYDGYLVLQSNDGTTWNQIANLTSGSTSSYVDPTSGQGSTPYTPPTSEPPVTYHSSCPSDTNIQYITAVSAEVKASGSVTTKLPFDIGIPGLSLTSTDSLNEPTAKAGWNLDLTFGVDKDSGFFVKADNSKVLSVNAEIVSPSSFTGQLSILKMDFTDNAKTNSCGSDTNLGSLACVQADLTLNSPSKEITAADLANPSQLGSDISANVSGNVNIDWGFQADVNSALPGVSGQFVLTWDPSLSTTSGLTAGDLDVEFKDVTIDAGSFLTGVLGPIVSEIKQVTDPLEPVVNTLTAPIPVLSDLSHLAGGGDVTLISIAEAFNTLAGGPDVTLINRLVSLLQLFGKLSSLTCSSKCSIDLGDYSITNSSGSGGNGNQQLLDNTVNPESGSDPSSIGTLPAPTDLGSTLSGDAGSGGGDLFPASDTSSGTGDGNAVSLNDNCAPSTSTGTSQTETAGLSFPVIEHPLNLFRLLMGQDIALSCFDSGLLHIGFSYSQSFGPVYAPPPVLITISGSASASLHMVGGFDTFGIREAIQNGKPADVLDSLFFTTDDQNGNPIPVVTLSGTLAAGAQVSVVVGSIGVQGGITLTVNFTWRDSDNSGKFRFDEFPTTALQNPLCLFNVSGSLGIFLELDITLGVSPFSVSFSITLVNIKLLDFSVQPDCTPPPPQLAGYDSGSKTLVLFMGNLGTGALRGDSAWDNGGNADETFKVTQYDKGDGSLGSGVAVDALGVHDVFPSSTQPINTVYVDAQGYKGNETVTMTGALDPSAVPSASTVQSSAGQGQVTPQQYPFTATAIVYGGNGNDTVTTGQGNSYISEGKGNDHVTSYDTSSTSATIGAGTGSNTIRTGEGNDSVAGNAGLVIPANLASAVNLQPPAGTSPTKSVGGVPDWTKTPTFPNSVTLAKSGTAGGADSISVGHGKNVVWGGGGGNVIDVAPDNAAAKLFSQGNFIVGGEGSNQIVGGDGPDTIFAGQYADPSASPVNGDPADNWTGVPGDHYDNVTIGTGNTTVYGGSGGNHVQGNSVPAKGANPVTSDTIYGGTGDDTLLGGNGNDKIYGEGGDDVIIGGTGSNLLVGGSQTNSNNYIIAGGGTVERLTGPGLPAVPDLAGYPGVPDRGKVTLPAPGTTHDGQNIIAGGGGSNHIWGGNGGDTIYGHFQNETCAAPAAGDHPYAVQYDVTKEHAGESSDTDWIQSGPGDDTISGGGGTNYIDSGSGNDLVCGGSGNDTITGHSTPSQVDKFYGISGNNIITGGNGNDQLFGGSGDDTIYSGSGNSYIEGGDGYNSIFAGGGNDVIIGGTSSPAQRHNQAAVNPIPGRTGGVIYGGGGQDVIVGDNGCSDMTAKGAAVSFPGQTVTVNSCYPPLYGSPNPSDNSPNLHVFDLDSGNPAYSENNYIVGGLGPSMIFGGLGSNTIIGGPGGNYIEGGTGPNYIQGGAGSNDIIGGSSPNYLPLGTCTGGTNQPATSCIPAGANIIYGDDGIGGKTCGCADGSNAIVADNGSIKRAGVYPGWQTAALAANLITWGDGSIVPNRTITDLDIYNSDLQGASSWLFAGTGHDFLFGGPDDDHIYGGPPITKQPIGTPGNQLCPAAPAPCIDPNGPYGNDYMEGGGGHNFLESADGQNDMIGGVSPFHLAPGETTTDVPNDGSIMYGGNGDNYMVADNGEIDHQCGAAGTPTVAACTNSSTQWTQDPNDGSFFRRVTLWDLPTLSGALGVGGDSELHTGDGYDNAYGGKGDNKLLGGLHDDFLMGGTGNNCISGGGGSNDIVGGTVPEVLPAGLHTSNIPSGSNVIYVDMVDGPTNSCLTGTPGGTSAGADDGSNVVIGNNGDITRQHDGSGVWIKSNNDPTDTGIIQRNITNLDIYAYPLASDPGTSDVVGGKDVIFGGTRDDILLGGPQANSIYAGPPTATGSIQDPTTGNHFDNTVDYGNKHIEGGPGVNAIFGSGGDDDIIGGVSPLYLAAGHDTGTVGSLDTPNHPGNLLVGGTGNDYIAGANARIDHLCGKTFQQPHVCAPVDPDHWTYNPNDKGGVAGPLGASTRQIQLLNLDTASGPTGAITHGIGSDNKIYGTGGDNHLYGENGNNFIQGGWGNDYIEGGTGNNLIQGGGGDKDIVGGTSPASLAPQPQGTVSANDAYVANHIPSGNNIICSFVCGQKMPAGTNDPLVMGDTSNDSVIVGHNGRIDRCAAAMVNGISTPQGSDVCTWQRTPYGNEKVSSYFDSAGVTGVAQTGQVCTAVGPGCPTLDLGSPRTRFTTLLGQSPTEIIQDGTDYIEGNIGDNVIYGEDGPAVIHAVTPRQDATGALPSALFPQYAEFTGSFLLSNECLPNPDYGTVYNQNIIVGGYGGAGTGGRANVNLHDLNNGFGTNDVLCGGFGDDAILGNRGTVGNLHPITAGDPLSGAVTPVPFSNAGGGPTTIGVTGGPPYGTLTVPGSGNTIYPVRLDVEYVDGVLTPVPNWNNPTATGQVNQHDVIFGGGGNNTIHGSPGADFIEGGDGMHIQGAPDPCAAVPPTPTAPAAGCAPTGDNIIFGGEGNSSVEGGPGNADIFGGPGNKDLNVKRVDTTMAPKVDDAGNCMPLAFPTINADPSSLGAANGYCATNPSFPQYQWANQSYASRFPAPNGKTYDYDPAGRDNGGTTSHTPVFGQVVISGMNRDLDQAQGFGDRMIGPNGAYNLFYVCPAAYGGYQIIRALKPALLSFEQQLASLDGAYNVNTTAKEPSSFGSGDYEIALVYSGSGNNGSAYPTTAGHFTC